jgi:hypothetical protein
LTETSLELVNPPDNVLSGIESLTQACKGWLPTAVPVPSLADPLPKPGVLPWPDEATICRFLLEPDYVFRTSVLQVGALLAIIAIILGVAIFLDQDRSKQDWP